MDMGSICDTTKICFRATFAPCHPRRLPDNGTQPCWENPARAGAEGATAPETLRPKDQQGADGTLERNAQAFAEGITISGKQTEGAHRKAQSRPNFEPALLAERKPRRRHLDET